MQIHGNHFSNNLISITIVRSWKNCGKNSTIARCWLKKEKFFRVAIVLLWFCFSIDSKNRQTTRRNWMQTAYQSVDFYVWECLILMRNLQPSFWFLFLFLFLCKIAYCIMKCENVQSIIRIYGRNVWKLLKNWPIFRVLWSFRSIELRTIFTILSSSISVRQICRCFSQLSNYFEMFGHGQSICSYQFFFAI